LDAENEVRRVAGLGEFLFRMIFVFLNGKAAVDQHPS
jgi:hypothetical protein